MSAILEFLKIVESDEIAIQLNTPLSATVFAPCSDEDYIYVDHSNDEESIIKLVGEYDDKGVDLARLTVGLIDLLKEVIIYKNSGNKSILKILNFQ